MRILVVGGSNGNVAGALSRLGAPDFRIEAHGRPQVDLADPVSLRKAIEDARPFVVICAGAYTAVDTAESEADIAMEINGGGPGALARACVDADVPLIHLSTDYVFSGRKAGAYVESDPTEPINVYGRTKLEGERGVIAAGSRHVILRISGVYAPRGKNFVRTMLRLAKTREEIGVVDDQFGHPTYAPHLAQAMVAIARRLAEDSKAPTGVFHMTGQGEICTWRTFAEAIFELSAERGGPFAIVKPIATEEYPTPARRPANSVLDCSRVAAAYGVTLPAWRESLACCIDAIAAEGWDVD